MQLVLFSKMFQALSLKEFAEIAAETGFEGVDLTVRSNGYIKPYEAEEKLPWAVGVFESEGLKVPMITTEITSVNQPYAEDVFKAASENGVKYLKLGYWQYRGFGFLRRQVAEIRVELRKIQELSRKYRVTSAVHIHSGMFMSAEPTVVWLILKGFNPDLVGAYVDPGHMAVEGGLAGWLMGMDILSRKIRIVSVKDYGWFREEGEWRVRTVPLGEGLVPWRKVFEILGKTGFNGPVSVHSEYDSPLAEILKQTRKDVEYLKNILSLL
ncbi:MAG: sugar phosphate isomerase/epimerase [Thaumarchaeota archaeon]|jgi:sugar phosphate isomerase/epimerase|nr:sugar phosphate isomerase/epimerase [Nitrososphaerota archaeon]